GVPAPELRSEAGLVELRIPGKAIFCIHWHIGEITLGSGNMAAEFWIEADRDHGIIRIRMAGFFTPHDIQRFLEARRVAHDSLGCAPNAHLTLNDIRGMTGQLQVTVDAFQEELDDR